MELIGIEKLRKDLSEYGVVKVLKEGFVFTLLITGKDMSKYTIVNNIQKLVLDYVGDKYPIIEVLNNSENFLLYILKPKTI
jgi:hypothetical protein